VNWKGKIVSIQPRTRVWRNLIQLLVKEEFKTATDIFDAEMGKQLSADKLGEIWGQLKSQVGAYQKEISRKQEVTNGYDVIIATTQFKKAPLNIRIVFNSDKQISGLFFQPAESANAGKYELPAYVKMDQIVEEDIVIGEGDWALPGTLTFPLGEGQWPMIILVHGSGPNDRDETIGPNKPFKDLALGLASRGIGVLRYDKRTLVHGQKIATKGEITVWEETIDDVIVAISLLKDLKKVDKKHIYILGHSLGGMLAPRIALQTNDLAGMIIMAGAARPLEDLIVEQKKYIAELDGTISDSEKADYTKAERLAQKVKDTFLDANTPSAELMGLPAEYWLDLQGYQPVEVAKRLDLPMLIIQGERDYQVTMEDYRIWRCGLQGKKGVSFKSFPSLNHLMMAGFSSGLSRPEEYQRADHLAVEVIDSIVEFIIER